jgi:hypothetical protein
LNEGNGLRLAELLFSELVIEDVGEISEIVLSLLKDLELENLSEEYVVSFFFSQYEKMGSASNHVKYLEYLGKLRIP